MALTWMWALVLGLAGEAPERESLPWPVIRSADGEIAFSMPGEPASETMRVPSGAGSAVVLTYTSDLGGTRFQFKRVEAARPIASSRVIGELSKQKERYLKDGARLLKETKIVVDGVIGDDFTVVRPSSQGAGDVTLRVRHLMEGEHYYVLSVETPPGKPLPVDATRFVSSLTFEAIVRAAHDGTNGRSSSPTNAQQTEPERGAPPGRGIEGAGERPGRATPGPSARVSLADTTPEAALKSFLLAMAAHDAETLRAVALPDPDLDWLLKGPAASPELLARIKTRLEEQPMRRMKAGDPVRMPGGEARVIHPEDVRQGRVVLWPEGAPLPSRVENVDGRWRVFARPFIAARKAAETMDKRARSSTPR